MESIDHLTATIRAAGIRDDRVLEAFRAIPRERFVPARGRLVQPIGPGGREDVTLFVADGGRLRACEILTDAHFVRLVGEHGFAAA